MDIASKYGQPGTTYERKYMELWEISKDFPWFPAKKIFINKDFRKKLTVAFTNLQRAGRHTEIKTFDGCYCIRNTRGYTSPSLHSWGMAIDLNAATERLGQTKSNWSGQFIAIMKAAGLYWGGDWGRPDPMHFALFNG